MTGLSAALVAGALVLAVVPPEIRKTRLGSLTALLRNDPASKAPLFSHEQTAQDNARVRVRIFSASMEVIRNQPLGNACLPESWYSEHGLMPGHSHNLVVEQYRSRGWLWGTLHLAIWITAGIFAWRRPDLIGSALIGGWVSIFVGGMFDHPWFVLNHSLVLWTFLLMALGTPAGINRLPVDLPPSKAS
jgi:hypothetical protein